MNIIDAELFLRKVLAKAEQDYNFDDAEVVFITSSHMSIDILKGEVSSYESSTTQTVSFGCKINGQIGSASTSSFTDEAIDFLLREANENCSVLDDEDEDFFYCDPENPKKVYSCLSENFHKNTYEKFVSVGLDLERRLLGIDSSIRGVDMLSISCGSGARLKLNSQGLNILIQDDDLSIYAAARGMQDGIVKSAGYFWYGDDIDKFDPEAFTEEVSRRLLPKYAAQSVKSGTYRIILGNEAMISFINAFLNNFSAYSMQKGISRLAGREGEIIASECVTLREDPFYQEAMVKLPFDYCGVSTSAKSIIENGRFNVPFYTLKSAHKANIPPTGNNFSGSLFTNLILQPGDRTFEELCAEVGDGLYITELSGLHAGVNSISGDFSLFCEGFRITDGRIGQAVEQITVSDNFYDVLMKISVVGNDTIAEPQDVGEFFCPSVIIDNISIAGDAAEDAAEMQ